jgi:hypothetical protein
MVAVNKHKTTLDLAACQWSSLAGLEAELAHWARASFIERFARISLRGLHLG